MRRLILALCLLAIPTSGLAIECIHVGHGIDRCESTEVVCYKSSWDNRAVQCFFKDVESLN